MRKRRKSKLMVEPPAASTGDIAFNLIVFFLVCASVQPDSGRSQSLPKSEQKEQKQEQSQNIEVALTRTGISINGAPTMLDDVGRQMAVLLADKPRPEDRVVVVKSAKDVPYAHWIAATGQIERAGGTITLQVEEEQTVFAPN